MKRLLALSLSILLILSGCGRVSGLERKKDVLKDIKSSGLNVSSSEEETNTNINSQNIQKGSAKQETEVTTDRVDKIHNDALQTVDELNKVLDSLDDIDESKLNF